MSNPTENIKYLNIVSNILFCVFLILLVVIGLRQSFSVNTGRINAIVIENVASHIDAALFRSNVISEIQGHFYNIDIFKVKEKIESTPWISRAIVKRVYPNKIYVNLKEFEPKGSWGNREELKLIDRHGTIFEAGADLEEFDKLPQFIGPEGRGKMMLDMYENLISIFPQHENKIKTLELNIRGNWILIMNNGAKIELGRGTTEDVVDRARKFALSLPATFQKLNKKMINLQYADLRHIDGYAIRLDGITTIDIIPTINK